MKKHKCPTCGAPLLFAMPTSLKLADEVGKWIEGLELEGRAESYTRKLKQRCRDYVIPYFKASSITEIRTYHVKQFYRELIKKGLASKTVKHVLDTLRAFLAYMRELEVIEGMPLFPKVKQLVSREKRWMDAITQAAIINNVDERHRLVFRVMCETGIRPGEACALKVKDIEEGGLMIRRAVNERGIEKGTKTGSETLRPLSAGVLEELKDRAALSLPGARLFMDKGLPYTQKKLYFLWRRASRKVGITISLYNATRHSRASQVRAAKEAEMREAVRESLGHAAAGTTLKHYALGGGQVVNIEAAREK